MKNYLAEVIYNIIRDAGMYKEDDMAVVQIYIMMSFGVMDVDDAMRKMREMGYNIGDSNRDDNQGGRPLPDLKIWWERLDEARETFV